MVRLVKGLRTRRTISSRGSTDPGNRVQALRPSRTYLDHLSIRQRGNPVSPRLPSIFKTRTPRRMAHNADGRSTKVHPHYCHLHPLPADPLITAPYSTPSLNASWQSSSHPLPSSNLPLLVVLGAIVICWDKTERISTDWKCPQQVPSCHPTLHGRQCRHTACTSRRSSLLLLPCTVTRSEE